MKEICVVLSVNIWIVRLIDKSVIEEFRMKYTFIVNPQSRSGRGGMIWKLVEPELKKERVDYEVYFTKYARHATELAAEITADDKEHRLVVLGGDGTVNEVVNGIYNCSKAVIGYIPTGSGNDFTRAMKLPTDTAEALENILHPGQILKMDVGEAHVGTETYRFAVSAGIGFDAAVCHQAAVSRLKVCLNKVGLGKLSYLGIALCRLLGDKTVEAEICLDDGNPQVYKKMYFTAIMNHPYEGGGFYFCPKADIGDGYLDVMVAHSLPKWKILLLLPTAFKGKHVRYKGIDIIRCKEITVRVKTKQPIHTDGEPVGIAGEIRVKLLPEQVRVLAP